MNHKIGNMPWCKEELCIFTELKWKDIMKLIEIMRSREVQVVTQDMVVFILVFFS